jgi:hypothetical protein
MSMERQMGIGEMPKLYLGDGVYVDFDGFHIVLTAENGVEATNTIYLEPDVLQHLEMYVAKLRERLKALGGKL